MASVRRLLRTILEEHDGLEVVGEAENGRMAIQLARELRPEVVIMDIAMPELDGIEASQRLLADQPQVRVIIHSAHSDPFLVGRAFRAGARGYVLKDDAVAEMPEAVRAIVSGQTYRSSSIRGVAPEPRNLPWAEVANARNRPEGYPEVATYNKRQKGATFEKPLPPLLTKQADRWIVSTYVRDQ